MKSTASTFHRLVDGGLLYDAAGACIHHLNETAAAICQDWRDGRSVEQIAERLTERYDVSVEQARQHVVDTIDSLKAARADSGPTGG